MNILKQKISFLILLTALSSCGTLDNSCDQESLTRSEYEICVANNAAIQSGAAAGAANAASNAATNASDAATFQLMNQPPPPPPPMMMPGF